MGSPSAFAMTLLEVRDALLILDELSKEKRSELRSGINTFAKVCGLPLASTLADPPTIRAAIARASPQLAGISKPSWANTQSRVTKAMALVGIKVHRRWTQLKQTQGWHGLLNACSADDKHDLSRFAGWSSTYKFEPADVDEGTFRSYLDYLQNNAVLQNPRERWNVARRAWNRIATANEGKFAQVPNNEAPAWRGLPIAAFPTSLQTELETYANAKLDTDPLAKLSMKENELTWRGRKSLKPVTVHGYVATLRQFGSRLIEDGMPMPQLASLAAFVEPATVKRALQLVQGARTFDQARPGMHAVMTAVLSVAHYLGVVGEELSELKFFAKSVRHRPTGMCATNKERLAPFSDAAVMRRMMRLPLDVAKRYAAVKSPTIGQAREMQLAVLTELLLHIPLRIKNAASVRLDKHFQFPVGGKSGAWRLSIPAGEVKNNKAIDTSFSVETSAFFERYVSVFRPLISNGQSMALFTSQDGNEKGPSALSTQFRRFVKRELGLTVNVHLMRHLMATAYLEVNPGDYEGARQLLGHKRIETTITFYAGAEIAAAFKRLDKLIDRARSDGKPSALNGDLDPIYVL